MVGMKGFPLLIFQVFFISFFNISFFQAVVSLNSVTTTEIWFEPSKSEIFPSRFEKHFCGRENLRREKRYLENM